MTAPLPAEVEEAMETLTMLVEVDGDVLENAALAVIRAALKLRKEKETDMSEPSVVPVKDMIAWLDGCGGTEDFPMFQVIRSQLRLSEKLEVENEKLLKANADWANTTMDPVRTRLLQVEKERLENAVSNLNNLNNAVSLKWLRCSQQITQMNKVIRRWKNRAKNYKAELESLKDKP